MALARATVRDEVAANLSLADRLRRPGVDRLRQSRHGIGRLLKLCNQIDRRFERQTGSQNAVTLENGWFVACAVPIDASVTIVAARGPDTTGTIEARFGEDSIVRLDLFLSSAVHRRSARLAGRITDDHGQPVAGRVALVGGTHEVAARVDGAFAMDSLPPGTQTLQVRAIGYTPSTLVVRLTSDKLTVANATLTRPIVLPTVLTRASTTADRLALFEQHKRTGAGGFFLKPETAEGYAPVLNLRQYVGGLPGVTITKQGDILIKRPATYMDPRNPYVVCAPRVFYNGKELYDEREFWIPCAVADIIGIEVYTRETQIPSIYPLPINRPCGLIVIWTRPP